MKLLSSEQRMERAVQHVIVFAQFAAHEFCQDGASDSDILCAAAARVYRAQQFMESGGQPVEWTSNHFAQYMRELVLDGAPVLPTKGA